MKLLDILQTASSNMFRSKLRSFLTIIAIFIGALTLTLTNGIGSGVATYIDNQLGGLGAEDVLMITPKTENPLESSGPQKYDPNLTLGSSGGPMGGATPVLTDKDLQTVRSQPGIKSADFDIVAAPDYIQGVNGEKYRLTTNSWIEGATVQTTAGSLPSNQTSERQLLLPPEFAKALGYGSDQDAVGKTVKIGIKEPNGSQQVVDATVVGVQEESLIAGAGAMINEPLSLALNDIQTRGLPSEKKDQYPTILARFDQSINDDELESIKDGLDKEGYAATTFQDQIGIIKQVIDAIIMVLNFFAGIALLAASFGIINTLFMAVQERTKEIGLMKAMGMSSRKVFLLFSIEAALLGFWGSLLGSLAGIGIGAIANNVAADTFLKDLVGFQLTSFPLMSILTIMLIIMTIAFVAGTLPARRAAKKDPIDALRYE